MPDKKGIFITFEGGEGAGKTTLIEELSKKLASLDFSIVKTREPGGTKLGEHIRNILLQHSKDMPISARAELCLFLASRAQHVGEIILPALEDGKIVLCDRFNDSSLAYQGGARELGIDKISPICSYMAYDLDPNLTFYLDLDPKIGLERAREHRKENGFDRIESEKIAFHQKIRDAFHAIAKKHPERIQILDASKPPKEVFRLAFEAIEDILEGRHLIK